MAIKKMKIQKGDRVLVRTGKNKGVSGEVLKVMPQESSLLVKGVNVVKRHMKPSAASGEGRIVYKELPIHVSNVALVDPQSGLPTKTGIRFLEDGTKERFSKTTGVAILRERVK